MDLTRLTTADFLRGIAVIFMIQVHLTELFAVPEFYESMGGRISLFLGGPPAAPLFMIIMGYFLIYKSKSSGDLFRRGVKLFAGGILLNIALNFNLLISIISGRFEYYVDPYRYIFGADILHLAGLTLIIFSVIQKYLSRFYPSYFILAAFVFVIQSYLPVYGSKDFSLLMYINAFLWGDFSWSYFPLIPWIAYPLTGAGFYYLLQNNTMALSSRIKVLFLLTWTVSLFLSIEYGISIASDLKEYYHHDILYYIWTLTFLSGFALLAVYFIKSSSIPSLTVYLSWIGRNVTAAYVFQWIIIGNIATELYRTQEVQDLIFWFAGILAAVSGLIYLYRKHFEGIKQFFSSYRRIFRPV
jgi:uncharacterized membrane protein